MTNEKLVFISMVVVLFVFGAIAVFNQQAQAESRHNPITPMIEIETTSGAAAALSAANIHFDWNTSKTQIGVGYGFYEDEHGLAIGIGRRFDEVLINGTLCGDKCAGAGFTLRF